LVIALGGAALYVKKASRIYEAKGSVYISAKSPRILESGGVAPEETKDLEQMRSVAQALIASTLLDHVIVAEKLVEDRTFNVDGISQQQLIGVLAKKVKVELRRGTRLIDISVQDTDPARAKRLVESLVSQYERWSADRQGGLTRQLADSMRGEEEALRTRMEQGETPNRAIVALLERLSLQAASADSVEQRAAIQFQQRLRPVVGQRPHARA
jgi:uncharacterized protein involved in exopolysaccharide biosynthesis